MQNSAISRLLAYVVTTLILCGCAVRYTERIPGFQPGYTDVRLGESTYQIKIGEAWQKDWPDLEKFAIYRAADITSSTGNRYFTVLRASSQTSSYHITPPATATTSATASRVGNMVYVNANTTSNPGISTSISGGWYILEFKMLSDAEAEKHEQVVDASKVKRDLEYFINSRR
jgi:hypothetical protein